MSCEVWKVFAPYELFNEPTSYLIGHVVTDNQSVYITASSHDTATANQLPSDLQVLGYWSRDENGNTSEKPHGKQEHWIKVWLDNGADIRCSVFEKRDSCLCTLIIYSPLDMLQSEMLKQRLEESSQQYDNITSLVRILHITNSCLSDYEVKDGVTMYTRLTNQSITRQTITWFFMLIVTLIYIPFRICGLGIGR